MESFSSADDLLWDEQQRAHKAQRDLEFREWMKSFVVVFSLIVFTLAAAAALASLVNTSPIRP